MTISTSQSEHGMGATAWPRGLAWVACQAATELDNLLLGKAVSIDAVKGLCSALSASVAVGTGAAASASPGIRLGNCSSIPSTLQGRPL